MDRQHGGVAGTARSEFSSAALQRFWARNAHAGPDLCAAQQRDLDPKIIFSTLRWVFQPSLK